MGGGSFNLYFKNSFDVDFLSFVQAAQAFQAGEA